MANKEQKTKAGATVCVNARVMPTHYVDLSMVTDKKVLDLYGETKRIPLIIGQHESKWDVVESDLPSDLVDKLRENARESVKKRYNGDNYLEAMLEDADTMPLGFNEISLIKGAAIIKA